jgi:hypothetical protein
MAVANTLAYYNMATITAVKNFIVGPRANVIKLLLPQPTRGPNKLLFVPDRPIQPSLMFVGKGRNLPKRGAPESGLQLGRLQPDVRMLD